MKAHARWYPLCMDTFVHALIFLVSTAIVWFFADVLIEAVSRISRRYCKSGFFTAFFLLGFLTSISELSVAVNSALEGVPGVSAGNLVGASFVVLLFIVPLLAVAGNGLRINEAVSKRTLALMLMTVALPALMLIDGDVTRTEGLLALLSYGTVAYALYRKRAPILACDPLEEDADGKLRGMAGDLARVLIGGAAIFAAAHFLVEQAVYFAGALSVPNSLIGLLVLSIGTNIPEIVIAFRSIFRGRADIALGDYLGSAAMNTLIFAGLATFTGTFSVVASGFIMTTVLFVSGLAFLFSFARSKHVLSRGEGAVLLLFYGAFVALQVWNILRLSGS